MTTPAVRRARGHLEELVREVCDIIDNGTLAATEGQPWTPHRLAAAVSDRYPGSGAKPSTGAIADTLKRWKDLGFADVSTEPLAFLGYTPDARDKGLASLKVESRQRRAAERAAKKADTSAAPADPDDPAPVVDRGADFPESVSVE